MERKSDRFRWSLAHPGGGYPILRIAARFLRVDYARIFVGFRTLDNGMAILCEDPTGIDEPDAWAVLEPTAPFPTAEAVELITGALGEAQVPG